MFKVSKRKAMFRLAFFAILVVFTVTGCAIYNNNKTVEVDALTPDGTTIPFQQTRSEDYPGGDGDDYILPVFSADIPNIGLREAFCGQHNADSPVGRTMTAEKRDIEQDPLLNVIKFVIFLYGHNNSVTQAARNRLFRDAWPNAEYAWVHFLISGYYDGDWYVLSDSDKENIKATWRELRSNYIETNSPAWQLAQNYQMYRAVDLSDSDVQHMFWLEDRPLGKITVNKIDSQTGTCTTQGNASFNGTTFSLINKTGYAITYNGVSYANNAVVDSKTLNGGQCSVSFEGLPYGNYDVKETNVGEGYEENPRVNSVTIPTNDSANVSTTFSNTVLLGKVTVNKKDSETGKCDVRARAHSFAGTTFQIINKSNNPVYIGNVAYAKDAVITSATKVFGENDCSFTINNLPYGKYWIKETVAASGYVKLDDPIEVTIPTNNSYSLTKEVKNTQIRGDLKFKKMDEDNNDPMPNTLFSISAIDENFNILETHFVVSNENGIVDTSNSFARHSFHTNGYDAMYNDGTTAYTTIPFLGYGTWFGLDTEGNSLPVNDNLGALPKGKYLIQEMRCDANTFCYDLKDQKKVVTIDQNNKTIDLGNWDNSCAVFEIGTEAVDGDDGDHYVEADEDVKIVDHIHYCARKGMKFTIKGILMNRETGEPFLVNGEPVENSIEVIPEHDDCEVGDDAEMEFVFDGTGYGGEKLVVFESLYYGDTEIITHEDLDDDFQTVEMVYIHTSAVNDEDKSKVLPLNEDVVIEDTVDYCLIPGKTYIIRGTLMDRDENAPFLVDGEKVQSEVTVTPEEKCGQAIMYFHINTTGLGGKRLVVFESLYLEEEPEKPIVKHEDIYNYDESIEVEPEVPETGIATKSDKSGESSNGAFAVMGGVVVLVGLGGYLFTRHSSKKNVMKF